MPDLTAKHVDWLSEFLQGALDPSILARLVPNDESKSTANWAPLDDGDNAPTIGSVTEDAPPGTGGSIGDDSHITATGAHVFYWMGPDHKIPNLFPFKAFKDGATLDFPAPGMGKLTIIIGIEGVQDNLISDDEYKQAGSFTWQVTADADGKLTLSPEQPVTSFPKGNTDFAVSFNPTENPGRGFVSVSVTLTGASTTRSGQLGGTGGVEKGGGSVGITGGWSTSTTPAPKAGTPIRFQLNLKPIVPEKPEPHATVTISPVSAVIKLTAEIKPFNSGEAVFKGDLVKEVHKQLWDQLSADDKHALAQGEVPGETWPDDGTKTGVKGKIEVHGYTDNQDTVSRNSKLGHARAQAVIDVLKNFGVPDTLFAPPISHDESDSVGDGYGPTDDRKKEHQDSNWRKVVVEMNVIRTTKPKS